MAELSRLAIVFCIVFGVTRCYAQEKFHITAPRYTLKLSRVIDGDTIIGDVIIDCPWDVSVVLRKQRIRLYGVDAHELKSPGGKEARDFVVSKIGLQDEIVLDPRGKDNFGRLLAEVWYEGFSLGAQLVEKKHAVWYKP